MMKRFHSGFAAMTALMLSLVLATGGAYAGKTTFVSTDFNSYSLNRTLWTLVNPQNDGSIAMTGTNTTDAAVSMSVPAGSEHSLWTTGDQTLRLMQNATNTDFNLEVKFLSGLTGGTGEAFQAQGVLIEADPNNKIEICFTTYTADSVRAYAATFIGGFGSPVVKVNKKMAAFGEGPMWMRVQRTGNSWKFLYSLDGSTFDEAITFTQALAVSKIGPFSLNAGTKPPDFTAVVDYFHNLDSIKIADDSQPAPPDTIPPYIHSVRVINLAANAMQVAWNTDKPTDGKLEYGTTLAYGSNAYSLDVKYSHYLTVTDLNPATTYNYRILAGDQAALVTTTGNFTAATGPTVTDGSSRSDAFNDSTLNPAVWSFVDARGDALAAIVDGQLAISVPEGTSHDLWTGGDFMPRAVQDLSSANVREFVARYNTGVSGSSDTYRFEGMVLEETPSRLMRFDFLNDGTDTRAFAASFAYGLDNAVPRFSVVVGPANIAPLYMRVRQYGALWTMDYSFDGTSWSQAGSFWEFISPVKVGIGAGNEANAGFMPPPFTSLVDFFQGALPASVRLTSPANDSTGLPLALTLTWNVAVGATGYHVQVARDSLFTVLVLNDSNVTFPTKNLTSLQNDQKYYWRVRAKNAKGSSLFSSPWRFTTIPGIPGAPSLLAPGNGGSNIPVNTTVRWSRVPNALAYYVQLGSDSTFATSLVVNDSTVTDTVRAVTGLTQDTRYFWRVRAKTIGGIGPFSVVWNFRTLVPLPAAVVLVSPALNGQVSKDTVLFIWRKAQPGVTRYALEYAPDSLFQFGLTDSSITDTTKVIRGILNNIRYFWRVRAYNPTGWGPFSDVGRFNVTYTSVASERLLPKEFELSQNFPNPFNPSTRIEFGVPRAGHVSLELYNMIGERVATLVDGEKSAGYHQIAFDGTRFASGVYFYRLVADQVVLMKKMVLVK